MSLAILLVASSAEDNHFENIMTLMLPKVANINITNKKMIFSLIEVFFMHVIIAIIPLYRKVSGPFFFRIIFDIKKSFLLQKKG